MNPSQLDNKQYKIKLQKTLEIIWYKNTIVINKIGIKTYFQIILFEQYHFGSL